MAASGSWADALNATLQLSLALQTFHDAVDQAYDRVENMLTDATGVRAVPVAQFVAATQQLRDATAILRRQ